MSLRCPRQPDPVRGCFRSPDCNQSRRIIARSPVKNNQQPQPSCMAYGEIGKLFPACSYAAVLAQSCNLGPTRMARISDLTY
jgi:hypothetical protein